MDRALELAGDRLIALPDGEIGERSDRYPNGDRSQWVAGLAGRLTRETELFDVVDPGTMNEQGFPVDFDSTARLRPRLGPAELGERLNLGYDTFAHRSSPHFARLRASAQCSDLRLQVGLPTGLGIAASVLSPARALRFAPAFAACVAREARSLVAAVGAEDLLFQIEAPAEVVMAHRVPRMAWRLASGPVLDLVRRLPDQVPVGLHLCYGDLNNVAAITPEDFGLLIGFAQSLLRRWPPSHTLAYIHLPFAAGTSPSPTDQARVSGAGRARAAGRFTPGGGFRTRDPQLGEPRDASGDDREGAGRPGRRRHCLRAGPAQPGDRRRAHPTLRPPGNRRLVARGRPPPVASRVEFYSQTPVDESGSTCRDDLFGRCVRRDDTRLEHSQFSELVVQGPGISGLGRVVTSLQPFQHCVAPRPQNEILHANLAGAKALDNAIQEPRTDNSVPHDCVARIGIRGRRVGRDIHHRSILGVRLRQRWRNETRPDGPIEPVRLQMDTSLTTRSESGADGRLPRARRARHDHHFSAAKHPAMVATWPACQKSC